MAALAFALPVEPVSVARVKDTVPVVARVPRLVCRWVRDPATGRLVCRWDSAPEIRRSHLHLTLVRLNHR